MKIIALVGILFLLTGCSIQTASWETVEDHSVSAEQALYGIAVGLPETALTDEVEGCRRYETQSLQVEVSTFFASDFDDAIHRLSGFSADKLTILQTQRFGLPEYQFAWYCQTEEGGKLCRADMVMDGMTCYAVVCCAPENGGEAAREEARQVFSSFGLLPEEVV